MAEPMYIVGGTLATTPSVGATGGSKAAGTSSAAGDVGSKTLATRNDNGATVQPGANGQYVGLSADSKGALFIHDVPAAAVAKSQPAASATSVTILAANPARRAATIVNRGTTVLSIDISGATAAIASATHDIQIGAQFEMPKPIITGLITGIWAGTPTGNAVVTETT